MTFDALLAACRREGEAQPLVVARQPIGVRLRAEWTPREGVEFALARTEVSTGASRHAFAIRAHPDVTIEQDLKRRDFTVNAMARDVSTGALIDPFGGAADLRAGVLRTVSETSFAEDPLRVLRGLVRCAKDQLTPEPVTLEQMRAWGEDPRRYLRSHVDKLVLASLDDDVVLAALIRDGVDPKDAAAVRAWAHAAVDDPAARGALEAVTGYRWYGDIPLSPERVWHELRKLVGAPHAVHALRIARSVGLLERLLPQLGDAIGFEQLSKYHDMTVDEHTLRVLKHACAVGAAENVRLAALLHDSGKPASAWGWLADGEDGWRAADAAEYLAAPVTDRRPGDPHLHFYARPGGGRAHEDIGAEFARHALARLVAPVDTRAPGRATRARAHVRRGRVRSPTLSAAARSRRARRFLARVGAEGR